MGSAQSPGRFTTQIRCADAYNNRGSARLDSGDKDGAVTDYREALKLSPGLSQATNMLKQLGAKPKDQR